MLLDAADAADAVGGFMAALWRLRSSEAADPVQQRGGYRWGGLWRRARGVGGARGAEKGGGCSDDGGGCCCAPPSVKKMFTLFHDF